MEFEFEFDTFMNNDISNAEAILDTFIELTQNCCAYIEDMKTHITWWSKAAQDMLGVEQRYEENALQHALERVHPDDHMRFLNDYTLLMDDADIDPLIMYHVKTKDNTYHFFSATTKMLNDQYGTPRYFLTLLRDINIHPDFDSLTDLMSQQKYIQIVHEKIVKKEKFAVLKIGIDKFANLNLTYGVGFGDKVLREIAYQFILMCTDDYSVYRLEGAKFAFILNDCTREQLLEFSEQINAILTHEFLIDGKKITLKISTGAIIIDNFDTPLDSTTIRENVTYATRLSKISSQGGLVIFNDLTQEKNKVDLEIIRVIHESVQMNCDGFYIQYQPIVSSIDGSIKGAEALVRWQKEPFGSIPPGMFIEWLENDPAMYDLGAYVLKSALIDAVNFIELVPDFILNVNISIRQLERKEFKTLVANLLKETGYPASHLCLELTERCKGLDISFLEEETRYFQSLGIRVAIDDYGTGSASTNIVIQVPVDEIKIDMTFIRGIQENQKKKTMVQSIINFANENGMDTCIEGVENKEIQDFLRTLNATWFQGYYYSKPITNNELIEYILAEIKRKE